MINIFESSTTFASYFRSIGIFYSGRFYSELTRNIDTLKEWIKEYDDWYKTITGIKYNKNLHLLYSRNIHFFIGNAPKLKHSRIIGLINLCNSFGFLSNIHIDLQDCEKTIPFIESIFNNSNELLFEIEWRKDLSCSQERRNFVKCFIDYLSSRKVSLILSGEYSYWERANVFSSININSSMFRIRPRNHDEPKHNSENSIVPSPCSTRFRIFVDSTGSIYPCLGLVGLLKYNLGNIKNSMWKEILNDEDTQKLLINWAQRSPYNGVQQKCISTNHLPAICQLHRNSFLEK